MKTALFLICTLLAQMSFAKGSGAPYTPETLSDGNWNGQNSIYFSVIPYQKGTGLGFGYEKSLGSNLGIGGTLTFLPEDDNTAAPLPGLVAIGGTMRLHFPAQFFDFYIAPGLDIMMMKLGNLDKTTLGASFAFGSLAQFNKSFAMGIELAVIQPWFNKEFYTVARSYYFNSSVTARFTF
jgi:hypothetical protein